MARRIVIQPESLPAVHTGGPDFSDQLNPRQLEAATWGEGPALVVAGAGTGKTRTLVHRVAWLVGNGIPPEEIVLLTFTRRAATQMLTRAATLLDGRCALVRGGTFHAFCLAILKQYASRLGYPTPFTVLDRSDSEDVVDVLRAGFVGRSAGKRFPKKRTLISLFSAVRNRNRSMEDILEGGYPHFLEFADTLTELHEAYIQYKKEQGLMDYDDLLVLTLQLFQQEPAVLREVAARNRHVLVDEFQDTNRAQALLVKAFASVHGNVMVVGDDAQSIYRFRGADLGNILRFPEEFPGAAIIKLEHNYRSTQSILDLANTVLARAHRQFEKRLYTERSAGDPPGLVPAPDDRFESRFVAQMVLQFREQGIPLHQMAVLFRSGHNSYDLEVELGRRNILFVKYGGLKLSEAAHVKDVIAHLKVLENPRDVVAWNRILQLLEGIGPKTAGRIVEWIQQGSGGPFSLDGASLSAAYVASLSRLFSLLQQLKREEAPLGAHLEAILAYYAPLLRSQYSEDYPKRETDLDHLTGVAAAFADRGAFLDSVALDPVELTALDVEQEEADEPPLVLSTIHSAKGLEFRVVFVIQALDGVLPSSYSIGDQEAMDEELRLLYVAITRAEDHLFLSYPMIQFRRYDGQYFTKPSRFLADLPETILEPCHLVEAPREPQTALPEASHSAALPAAEVNLPAPNASEPDDDLPF
ncbi:MAG: ATP-dependent helicase [Bacteroidetes bacterium]|nr:ATP-dependent helicase [Bacteroidota bacterium]